MEMVIRLENVIPSTVNRQLTIFVDHSRVGLGPLVESGESGNQSGAEYAGGSGGRVSGSHGETGK